MAIDEVRQRLLRAAAALEAGQVKYAVLGGNAVAEWVGRVDKTAVRFTRDVDILLRREDLKAAIAAMGTAGFIFHETLGVPMFIDGEHGSAREAVHLLYANEKVRNTDLLATPDVEPFDAARGFRVVPLESLVQLKLTSFRDKARVHLRDLIEVGLVDATWLQRLEPLLAERLQHLLDNPE